LSIVGFSDNEGLRFIPGGALGSPSEAEASIQSSDRRDDEIGPVFITENLDWACVVYY